MTDKPELPTNEDAACIGSFPIREDTSVLGDHPMMRQGITVLGPDDPNKGKLGWIWIDGTRCYFNIMKIKAIANNALYFNDSSDYRSALWEILTIAAPEMFPEEDSIPKLEYMEEE